MTNRPPPLVAITIAVSVAAAVAGASLVRAAASPPAAAPPPTSAPAARDLAAELPRIPPRTPAESAAMIRTIPGFRAQLVAAEPLVFSPVAIDFDEDGRAFVCEMVDYPFPEPEPMGRIAVLEDTDGDGVYDKRTVLAERLRWPTAVLCYAGGCFVGSAPDLLYLKDGDGDGKVTPGSKTDVRKIVFTGFGDKNVQGLLNSFRWGIDNRVQGATGTNGGKIRRADLPADAPTNAPVSLSGRDFSFDPRKLDLRPESGGGQHGMCFDDFGRKFVCSNSDHIQQVVYDDRYAAAGNPAVPLPPARVSIAADGPQAPVFRISPVEPWRIVRTRMRVSGESKGLIEGGGTPAGYFTGATGVTIYRGDAFPPEYKGQAFIGDVGSNLVHRKVLKPTGGVLLRAERVDEGREFLASADIWFRPAQFANAPDGTLYVLDVCREVIEHPDSLPESIKRHLDLTSGRDRGRIYRVVPDGYHQRSVPKLGKLSTAELVKLLEHPNGWHRDTASRLLYERQDKAALGPLHEIVEAAGWDHSVAPDERVHAMYVLQSIGGTGELVKMMRRLFQYRDDEPFHTIEPAVFVHALRLLEGVKLTTVTATWLPDWEDEAVLRDPDVRLQSALTFARRVGDGPDVDRFQHAREIADAIAMGPPADEYGRAALLAAVRGDVADVFKDVIHQPAALDRADVRAALRSLAQMAATRGRAGDVSRVVEAIDVALVPNAKPAAREALLGLVAGSRRPAASSAERPVLPEPTTQLLAEVTANVQRAARDPGTPLAERVLAIADLRFLPSAETSDTLAGLLRGKGPQEVQLAAVAALDSFAEEPAVGDVLTTAWPRLTPRVRAAALDAVLARPGRAVAFLSAIEAGKIPAADLDAARLKRLQASKDAKVRELADAVAKRLALSPRADVVAIYRKALDLKGDPAAGRALFAQSCATCHKLEGVGVEIGPNLVAMQSRWAEAVLLNVLDPNREVNGQYVEYVVETKDGRTLSGLLASETAAAVTLLKPGGQAETVARAEIDQLRGSGLSLMPEGFEKQLTEQQMADLIAYVMSAN